MRTLHTEKAVDLYNGAVACYWRGDLPDVLEMLKNAVDPASIILRARAFRRLEQDMQTVASLERHRSASWEDRFKAEALVTAASALTRLNRIAEAKLSLEGAWRHSLGCHSVGLNLELLNCESLIHFAAQDLESTKKFARLALAAANNASSLRYFVPLESSKALALEHLALVAAASGSYRKQAAYAEAAIDTLERGATFDAWRHVFILETLSSTLREIDLEGNARFVAQRVDRVGPGTSLQGARVNILRSMCHRQLLLARNQSARDGLNGIADLPAKTPIRIQAILDGVLVNEERALSPKSVEALDRAERLSSQITWKDVGECRLVLLTLARELSRVSTKRARRALQTYEAISTPLTPTLLANFNSRRSAEEAHAWGFVFRAEGQKEQAVAKLQEAFEAYDAVGYRWRATLAAVELAELTGSQYFGNFAMKEADVRPNSWLARRVHLSRIRVARGG